MIIGVGTDMTELARMARAMENQRLADRLFTPAELALGQARGQAASVLAGCFAAKEALVKAMGTGFAGFWPKEVEVLRGAAGEPVVTLYGKAKALAAQRGIQRIHVSISNTAVYAIAFAVAEGSHLHEGCDSGGTSPH